LPFHSQSSALVGLVHPNFPLLADKAQKAALQWSKVGFSWQIRALQFVSFPYWHDALDGVDGSQHPGDDGVLLHQASLQ
tara:strand:- start:135 stop:371 length:237 start_codon:yes stop_codon:yes gene_type:complete